MPLTCDDAPADHPLSIVEYMASCNGWEFSRTIDDEITLAVAGKRTDYLASFRWLEDIRVLHFACAFQMRAPSAHLTELQQLIGSVNELLWLGHFDLWDQSGLIMFRHSLLLTGGVSTSAQQCEALLGAALESCERYYPALQFVVWAGKSAREALDAVMIDVTGKA